MLRTFASIALLLVTALAGAAAARFGHFAFDVPARGFEEHCLKLEGGERIRYRFRANGDVDFLDAAQGSITNQLAGAPDTWLRADALCV